MRDARWTFLIVFVLVGLRIAMACGGVVDGGPDASGTDATLADAGADASSSDAIVDASWADIDWYLGDDASYSALDDTSKWSTYDMPLATDGGYAGIGTGDGFSGAAFDGRYVYFVPSQESAAFVARYDTQATFATDTSWSFFDMRTVNANATQYSGAAFDGRYVYFVPHSPLAPVARYDTQAGFGAGSSWSFFDATTVTANAVGYAGAVFDGHFIYFVPSFAMGDAGYVYASGLVTRYDTSASFVAGSSWSVFDLATVSANAVGFMGGVYDGRYVYFAPSFGVAGRYDTLAPFTASASWSTFGTTSSGGGFAGAAFDGRYVYLVSSHLGASYDPARYDTQADFTAPSSWTTPTTIAGSYNHASSGAAFDGRYVYYVPYCQQFPYDPDGHIIRYDVHADFTTGASFAIFDIGSISLAARGFSGAAFDGRYVYLVPKSGNNNGSTKTVARFDAKQPAALPQGPAHGSFY